MIGMTYKGLDEAIKKLDPKIMHISMSVALKRTGVAGRKVIARELRKLYNLKSSHIKNAINISKIQTYVGGARIKFLSKDKRIPLIDFNPSQKKVGVSIRILKGTGRKILPHAFITTVRSKQVFEREQKGNKRVARHPLAPLMGPSIYTLARGKKIFNMARDYMKEMYRKNYLHEINYRMGKKLGRPFDIMGGEEE